MLDIVDVVESVTYVFSMRATLGALGPDFGTWESTALNRNAQNHAVKDLGGRVAGLALGLN